MMYTRVNMSAHDSAVMTMTRAYRGSVRKLGLLASYLGLTQPQTLDLLLDEALATRNLAFDPTAQTEPSRRNRKKAV